MGQSIAIPKLGTITVPVRNAPIQIPLSLPGWNTPRFANGTGGIGNGSPLHSYGGYWGLNYLYTNGQFSTNPSNVFDPLAGWQIAGGVVQSFGIHDFYAGPSPTGTKTSPYGGGAAENLANTVWAQGPDSIYMMRVNSGAGGSSSGIWPGAVRVTKFPLPNLMFANQIQSGDISNYLYTWATIPAAGGNLFQATMPVMRPANGLGNAFLIPPGRYANVNLGNPNSASGQVIVRPVIDWGSGIAPPLQPPPNAWATAYTVPTGPVTSAGVITPAIATFGGTQLSFSPAYNTFIGRHQTLGPILFPLLIPDYLLSQGNNQLAQHAVQFTLADPNDQADLVSHSGIGGGWTVMPDGNFLVQSPNSLVSNYYMISPQGTGYYKMVVTGATAPGYSAAAGGFGVDTNGTFWAFTANPTLVSNLGLPTPPIFQPFPQVSANWVGCRRNQCAYPWYG